MYIYLRINGRYLLKAESPIPKRMLCVNIGPVVLVKKISSINFRNFVISFPRKRVWSFIWKVLTPPPLTNNTVCNVLAEIDPVDLEKQVFRYYQCIFITISPRNKAKLSIWTNLNSLHCLLEKRIFKNFWQCIFTISILSRKAWPFIWTPNILVRSLIEICRGRLLNFVDLN